MWSNRGSIYNYRQKWLFCPLKAALKRFHNSLPLLHACKNTEAFKMKNPEQTKAQFDILYERRENHSDKHYATELDQSRSSDTKRENEFLSTQLAAGSLPINTLLFFSFKIKNSNKKILRYTTTVVTETRLSFKTGPKSNTKYIPSVVIIVFVWCVHVTLLFPTRSLSRQHVRCAAASQWTAGELHVLL